MNQIRRNILLSTGGALGGALLAAPGAPTAAPTKQVVLLSTYVAGTAYHGADLVAAALHPDEPVVLEREPGNDYDPRAVAVSTRSGIRLGYIPRIDNQAISSLIDSGFEVSARIREVVTDPRQPEIRLDVLLVA